MNPLINNYLDYVRTVRRYSPRTAEVYSEVLSEFAVTVAENSDSEEDMLGSLNQSAIRNYEVHLLDERKLDPRTVNLHLSVLSGFCRYLVVSGKLKSNPVRLVTRPKMSKSIPEFYRDKSVEEYLESSKHSSSEDELELLRTFGDGVAENKTAKELYERRLRRLIVSLLHATGIRRAELISLKVSSVDMSRKTLKVLGKGDKVRIIPLLPSVCEELSLYNEAVEIFFGVCREPQDPLMVTASGRALYPVYVDRAVKHELGGVKDITGRKSPHVLRHTLATELLNEGTDLNSIKEMLGHSSLAATQVYTHNSIEKLRKVYSEAHPRAKK